MVSRRRENSEKRPVKQGRISPTPEPNRIGASTPFDFTAKHLTPYGGLLPVATMVEKLGFEQLVTDTLTIARVPRAMRAYQFVLAMVIGLYIGFARLHQLRFVARDSIVTGILHVTQLPPPSTLWRFLDSLLRHVAQQILRVQATLRQRVWAASHVRLATVTVDTDTTIHTIYGDKMGARKSYNPKNKGKKSDQPILTFLAETREYLWGELHNGDRPTGKQIAAHLRGVFTALPVSDAKRQARADSGFYCWEAVEAYEHAGCRFVVVARKTARLVAQLTQATWTASPDTDADAQCEFRYQPTGWPRPYRFVALRYEAPPGEPTSAIEQYQLFATDAYTYGNAGLQPELLAHVVPARRDGDRRVHDAAYDVSDRATEVSLCRRQDLAPCGSSGRELQRGRRGAGRPATPDGSTAAHDWGVCASHQTGVHVRSAVPSCA